MIECQFRWRVNVFPKEYYRYDFHVESYSMVMSCDYETARTDAIHFCRRLGLRSGWYVIINDRSFEIKGRYDFDAEDHYLAEQDV